MASPISTGCIPESTTTRCSVTPLTHRCLMATICAGGPVTALSEGEKPETPGDATERTLFDEPRKGHADDAGSDHHNAGILRCPLRSAFQIQVEIAPCSERKCDFMLNVAARGVAFGLHQFGLGRLIFTDCQQLYNRPYSLSMFHYPPDAHNFVGLTIGEERHGAVYTS
jgi:hypothetical protein